VQVSIFELTVEHDQHPAADCLVASLQDPVAGKRSKLLQLDFQDRLFRHNRHRSLYQQVTQPQRN
jgi:hypothetical protein